MIPVCPMPFGIGGTRIFQAFRYRTISAIQKRRMIRMDVMEALFTRRSIRRYTGEPVSEEDLKLLLKAGFCAPSAHNKQPWQFVIVRNRDTLEEIARLHPYAKMLPQAGCGIIVCGDTNRENHIGYLVEDCSAAIENILLAAHGLGLGAVWCGLYPVQERVDAVAKLLNMPSDMIPIGLVVVGHGQDKGREVDRFDEARVHYEKWKV